jgi:phosphoribosylformylglycinamidine synthase
VPDVRYVPDRWHTGDVILLAEAPGPFELAAEVALIRYVAKAAPLVTLAHDVSDGGLQIALAEAALWSGVGAELELPDESDSGLVILACAREDLDGLGTKGLRRIGVVGGDTLLEVPVTELREAWET